MEVMRRMCPSPKPSWEYIMIRGSCRGSMSKKSPLSFADRTVYGGKTDGINSCSTGKARRMVINVGQMSRQPAIMVLSRTVAHDGEEGSRARMNILTCILYGTQHLQAEQ